jgi:CRP-like cAMP-binding protein
MDSSARAAAKEFLLGIPLFGGLPDGAMDQLLALMQTRRHAEGECICQEGDPGKEMFVVVSGEVEVKKCVGPDGRETTLAKLRVGDCFGEMSLIDVQPRSASVLALKDTELYVVSNMDLYQLYQSDLPAYTFLVQNICRELSRRLRRADRAIADFYLRLEEFAKMARD